METHTITHQNTSLTFTLQRSKKRRRTLAIHISSKKGIEVKVPYATKFEQVLTLLIQRFSWIQNKLATLPPKEIKLEPWHEREQIFYLGRAYPLKLDTFPFAKKRGECVLTNEELTLTLAQGLEAKQQQKLKQATLETWYRQEAETWLRTRTHYFAELMQVRPKSIIIKTQKRRWGSCDRQNNIRYNWKIMMAAPELIDYLVVHELAHIRVKNHSKKFWQVVASVLPDHLRLRKSLREFNRQLALD